MGVTDMAISEASTTGRSNLIGRGLFFERIKKRLETCGTPFRIIMPDGQTFDFGTGAPLFEIIAKNAKGVRALASLHEGIIANAYIDGTIDIEGDFSRIYDLRTGLTDKHPLTWLWRFIAPALFGQIRLNKSAIHSHYDRDATFHLSFLDEQTRCYTQAIFEQPDEPIEVAVRRKFDFCIEQCNLIAGSEVLEVGPGWGSFSEHAGRKGINITGITISRSSLEYMEALSKERNLPITTSMGDILNYESEKKFDAIVLMGIMEHLPNYPRVLRQFQALLKPGGFVYLDASACRIKYKHSSFITEHIYPGNHSFLSLHNFLKAVNKTPMKLRGVWDDRESYHRSFVHWAKRFESNRAFISEKFGERDFRSFHLYLWGSAHGFLHDKLQCYRVVLQAS